MKRTRALNSDKILKTLSKSEGATNVRIIARNTKLEIYQVKHHLYHLREKGFVNFLNQGSDQLQDADFIELRAQGRFYLQDEGGFREEYRSNLLKKIWLWVKIIGTVLYSLAVLAVSIWAVKSSSQTSDHEKRLDKLEQVLEEIRKK